MPMLTASGDIDQIMIKYTLFEKLANTGALSRILNNYSPINVDLSSLYVIMCAQL